MIFPLRAVKRSEDVLVVGSSPIWRIGFIVGGVALLVGGLAQRSIALAVLGALMIIAAARVERWEFDRTHGSVKHLRGLAAVFRTSEYPMADLVAVHVFRTSGRWSEAVDDSRVSGDRYASARGFRRGFARLSLEFSDGKRGVIQTDSLRAYRRMLATAQQIERHTGTTLRDE